MNVDDCNMVVLIMGALTKLDMMLMTGVVLKVLLRGQKWIGDEFAAMLSPV